MCPALRKPNTELEFTVPSRLWNIYLRDNGILCWKKKKGGGDLLSDSLNNKATNVFSNHLLYKTCVLQNTAQEHRCYIS